MRRIWLNLESLRAGLPPKLVRIAHEIQNAGGISYLVGGWVRDALLGIESRDYDIEVYGIGQDTLLEVLGRHGKPNLVGKSYGVIHLASRGMHFDFSFPRLESKTGVGHRAFSVETRPDLDFYTAALRRDFTINAMGMMLPELNLIDPHGGIGDLDKKCLRHVSPAFAEDPLRVLRAVQFAARFELSIEPATVELCKSLDLRELSRERFYEEFRKWLLKSRHPSFGLRAFRQMELYRFFPGIEPQTDAEWLHLGVMLDHAAQMQIADEMDRIVLLFSLLCHSCESLDAVVRFLESLTNEIQILRQVPQLWQEGPHFAEDIHTGKAFDAPTMRRQALRFSLPQTLRWVEAVWSVTRATELPVLQGVQRQAMDLEIWDAPPQPLLTGKMLLDFGQRPGRYFGEWIAECFEEQLDGHICTAEQAGEWARRKISASETS